MGEGKEQKRKETENGREGERWEGKEGKGGEKEEMKRAANSGGGGCLLVLRRYGRLCSKLHRHDSCYHYHNATVSATDNITTLNDLQI